jgi:amino acid adenylation domain-containing protein/thioester reductase-like protein
MEIANIYPLTPMQEGMLFHALLEPHSPAYHVQLRLTLEGEVDVERFERCVNVVIGAHEALRTTFVHERVGAPKQVVLRSRPISVTREDLRHLDAAAQQAQLRAFARDDLARRFDLTHDPLLRVALFHVATSRWELLWSNHHIVLDGWSLSVVFADILSLYAAERSGSPSSLPPSPPFERYVRWAQRRDPGAARRFWQEQLEGFTTPTGLFRSGTGGGRRHRVHALRVDEQRSRAFSRLARDLGVTPAGLLQCLWAVLLHRHNDTDDVCFGTVVSGRPPEIDGVESMVGLFIGAVPVRVQLDGTMTIAALAGSLRDATAERSAFELLPLAAILSATPLGAGLFDHLLVFENYPIAEAGRGLAEDAIGFRVCGADVVEETHYGLTVSASLGAQLTVRMSFDERIYEPPAIEAAALQLRRLVEQAVANPALPLSQLDLLDDAEREILTGAWAQPRRAAPFDGTIHRLFEAVVRAHGSDIAVVEPGRGQMTYDELNRASNRLAHELRRRGVVPDEPVGMYMGRSRWSVVSMLATLKAGGAYVPIDPEQPRERVRHIVEVSRARIVLTTSDRTPALEGMGVDCIAVDVAVDALDTAGTNPRAVNHADHLAYVMFTSGSTGRPKGVMVPHRGVVRLVKGSDFITITAGDRFLPTGSMAFDASTFEIWGALLNGARVYLAGERALLEPERLRRLLLEEDITVLWLTSSWFNQLVDLDVSMFGKLEHLLVGGESLSHAHVNKVRRAWPRLVVTNGYGPTENTTFSTTFRIEREYDAAIPIGRPIARSSAYVLDKGLRTVPLGAIGEICVGGEGLARGYLDDEAATAERFVPHPFAAGERLYRTGDLGRWLPDGTLAFVGRSDDQLKLRGHRIEPGEIEHALRRHEAVATAVVLASQGPEARLEAYFTAERALPVAELRAWLAERLPAYMVPAALVQLAELPLNANGKVDRARLRELAPHEAVAYVAPVTETERRLASIWQELLGRERVGLEEDYFLLGGDSIRAIRMVSRINKDLGAKLEIRDLFTHRDIGALGAHIDRAGAADAGDLCSREEASAELAAVRDDILRDAERRARLPDTWLDLYPMSDIQQGMVFHYLLHPDAGVYHEQIFHELVEAAFEPERFQRAHDQLVAKHEILRTSFHPTGFGAPIQIVHRPEAAAAPIQHHDLAGWPEDAQRAHVADVLARDRADRFALDRPGLWRTHLFATGGERYGLLRTFHHAILDGWSDASLVTELLNTYRALGDNPGYRAPRLACSFRDFVADQQRHKRSERARAFWRAELRGSRRTPLPLAASHVDAAAERDWRRSGFAAHLEPAIVADLVRLSQARRVSLKELCLAAWVAVVQLCTQEDEVVIGVVSHSRPDVEDGDKLLGCFLNTAPLRVRADPRRTAAGWVDAVCERARAVQRHDKLPLFEIAREAGADARAVNPLSDHLFGFLDMHVYAQAQAQIGFGAGIGETFAVTNTLLDVVALREGERLGFSLGSLRRLYAPEDLGRLFGCLGRVLERFCSHPDEPLRPEHLLTAEERDRLICTGEGDALPLPGDDTLHAAFERMVDRAPHAVALRRGGDTVTYAELDRRANRYAHELRRRGVDREHVVAVVGERRPETVAALLGVLKAGGAFLSLDPAYPPARIAHLLRASGAVLLIAGAWPVASESGCPVIRTEDPALAAQPTTRPDARSEAGDLAYLLYTSGSTGQPKGAMVEHRALLNTVAATGARLDLAAGDRVLQFSSPGFDAAVWETFVALLRGAELVLAEAETLREPRLLLECMHQQRVTHALVPPAYLRMVDLREVPSLRCLISGGEAARREDAERYRARLRFFNAYGPTECAVIAAMHEVDPGEDAAVIPIGRALANMACDVLDRDGALVPQGAPGELCISGPGVGRGYLDDAETTASRFTAHPFRAGLRMYRTGDRVRRRPDGALEFLGRDDRQLKVRGFRVEPGEIEHAVAALPSVLHCAVTTFRAGEGVDSLVAYVVPSEKGTAADIAALRGALAEHLPQHMVPERVVLVERLPLTAHGKIDWHALPKPHGAEPEARHVAPRNDAERELAAVFCEVLGLERVGVHDAFFDLGGNSLLLVRLQQRLAAELGFEVSMYTLYQYPTVAALAAQRRPPEGRVASVELVDPDVEAALSEEITLNGQAPVAATPGAVLVTGATGFVGAFLVDELVERTGAEVVCLVRGPAPAARMRRNLEQYGLWNERVAERVRVVPGDLTRPRLGLAAADHDELSERVEAIYHAGAAVNFTDSYHQARAGNVEATREVLRFATTRRLKPVHHVSTLSVFSGHDREHAESSPVRGQVHSLLAGYAASKWVAELLVLEAAARGVPCAIYRLGRITGHSRTGACKADDYFHRMLLGCARLGAYPRVMGEEELDLTPIDYAASAIVALSTRADAGGRCWHVVNPHRVDFVFLASQLTRHLGLSLEVLPYREWLARARATSAGGDESMFSRLLPLLGHADLDEVERVTRAIRCDVTVAALREHGVHAPRVDDTLMQTYCTYFRDHGLIAGGGGARVD